MKDVYDIACDFADKFLMKDFVKDKSGCDMLEIINASFVADWPSIFGTVDVDYVARELEWYKSQSLNVNDIPGGPPKIWKQVATTDGWINSNYGWMIFSEKNHHQYQRCLQQLLSDRTTRRAEMIYTRPSMQEEYNLSGKSDFCCTDAVQYVIRDRKLHAMVRMRSNDAWAGYRNDRAWQEWVLDKLVQDYNASVASDLSVKPGRIYWNAGSLHIYSRQFYLVHNFIETGEFSITKDEYRKRWPESQLG